MSNYCEGGEPVPRYPKGVRYYREYTDDFLGSGERCELKFDYGRDRRAGFRIGSFILYRLIATPIAFIHSALFLRQRVVGRDRLRAYRRSVKRAKRGTLPAGDSCIGAAGILLVCNHCERVGDAFTPSVAAFPRRTHVVVHPDNLSLPVLGQLTAMLGAIPVPNDLRSARDFSRSLSDKLARGHAVAIYPEAHLWEKYTAIRPFADSALDPAVRCGAPVFACTRVYLRRPVVGYVTRLYIDGPFYPNQNLSRSAACRDLAARVHAKMQERAEESNVEVIKYIKEENPTGQGTAE